ncbi:MAG TPA: exodeoxyribonuclease V subunit gamma [Kofleriaceae bacterium]|nr:exodeoxyribonuclease V subunit gamma [Kofleriaceae bacterium]
MLHAVHSNRVEELFAALLEALPPADPFAPSRIVVGSDLVGRWLVREIALERGIASGLELLTFDRFLELVWAQDERGRARKIAGLDRRRLAAALASVLADEDFVNGLPPVAAYLAAAPAPGDRAAPRRVQLAEHVAELAWSYALTRPDWMPALLAGKAPAALAGSSTARWQAALIGAAIKGLPRDRRWVPAPMLPWLRRKLGIPTPRLDAPLAAFGMSFLARAQLEALTDLAETTDVTVYVLDPCKELWEDVAGRRRKHVTAPAWSVDPAGAAAAAVTAEATDEDIFGDDAAADANADDAAADADDDDDATAPAPIAVEPEAIDDGAPDPLPLILWGRPVRDTLSALVDRSGGLLEGRFVEPAGQSARERLLADVLVRAAPSGAVSAEPGVQVLACPNARREIEAIASEVRRRLDADPTLSAHQIGVWIAGDAEAYLALAPSAFEAVGVPCHLIDAPIDDRGRIGEAVLALLELPTSTMARRDLLRVMTHPAVLAGHPHVDGADWVRWTDRLGIAHGADASAYLNTYLEEHPGHFHWDQGVRRLALGAFMIGERSDRGPARIAGEPFAPEELRPDQQASAATYALLVRSLCSDAAWLGDAQLPLARWADVLASLVGDYLAPRDEEAQRDLERVRSLLAGLAQMDIDGRELGFREAREHAARLLGAARASRGEPLSAGVMIAPLAAMRAVPFRLSFVAGLDEGVFPAGEQTSPLDVRRDTRRGDVSPRDRDRSAFLDVLLCARDALYLSYVAVEPKSGQPLGPSSVVLELADALAPYLGAPSSREALESITVRHPLHRFGVPQGLPRAAAAAVLPAVARERWGIAVRDALHAHLRAAGHPIPDEDGQLALLAHASQAQLRAALAIEEVPAAPPAAAGPDARPLTISNLRAFLEHPVQAWAQAVLGLDELPDDSAAEHSDEPFHLTRAERARVLREVFAAHLREPGRPLEERYDEYVSGLALRGQFPVGVFAEAARALDLRLLEQWRAALGPIAVGAAVRFGFGRASAPGAELRPALVLALSGCRTIRLVGQTELLLRGEVFTSVVPVLRKVESRSPYHLRGALDHLVLAAAGLAPSGHAHILLDGEGQARRVEHRPWTEAEARAHLAALADELVGASHGYLLPFEALAKALGGGKPPSRYGDPTGGLGFGPIERADGLEAPEDAAAIAHRRLGPLVERMLGDHGFEGARASRSEGRR